MASLSGDEDFAHPVVEAHRRLGHDVLNATEAGQADRGVADADYLASAARLGRAVVTFNRRDFLRLHRENPSQAGIIDCTRDADTSALAARIDDAIAREASLLSTLIRIDRPS